MAKRGLGKGLGALFGEEVTLEENAAVKEEKPSAVEKKEKGKTSSGTGNGKKAGNDRHFDTKGEVYPLEVNEKSVFFCFPSPHPTPFVYQQITSRKDNKEPGTSSLSAGQRFQYPA